MLPLTLINSDADLSREWTFSRNDYFVENGLVRIRLGNAESSQSFSFLSLYGYILWYAFYRTIEEDNKLYTSMFSFMQKQSSTEFLSKLKPVISVAHGHCYDA